MQVCCRQARSPADGPLYAIIHGRDNTHRFWPNLVSAEDDDNIADEMHLITKGVDFGWPDTYYDGVRKARLVSPEYGALLTKARESAPGAAIKAWRWAAGRRR